jgi:CheY-like chemotaxis protein
VTPPRKRSILVVDDEPDIRATLGALLQLEGFHVIVAEHGGAALAAVDRGPPDLVIVDYMMPYMNGRDFIQRLKSEQRTRAIPVILSSAVAPRGPAAWEAFLRKPVSMDELLRTIDRLLRAQNRGKHL